MRIAVIACRVFTRELSYYVSQSPHAVEVFWLPQGLHDTPDRLRRMIADTLGEIDRQREERLLKYSPDAIALAYGLCSNGVVGLESRDVPLIVPRTDDCIAQFLGSQRRYLALFADNPGTYWLNSGWIETAFLPTDENLARQREEYAALYGEDNADYLLDQDGVWMKHYRACGYIDSPVYAGGAHRDTARRLAAERGWGFREWKGDNRLIRALAFGEWNEEEFCIVPPRHRIEAAYDGTKLRAVPL